VRVVVITGAAGGLGAALTLTLGGRGFHVLALCRGDTSAARELGARMAAAGVRGEILRHDITSTEAADTLSRSDAIGAATELMLVNNACAKLEPRPFHLHEWSEIQAALDVAAKGSFLCTRALLRPLVAKRGTVVSVLSRAVTGEVPKGFAGYIIAKSALLGASRALAAEYAGRLRVFTVSPGFMDTPLTAGLDPRLREAMRADGVRTVESVAEAITDRACSEQTPGRGEDYPL
jgi:3-oxoacyl-[acyl-carrier protein] reductase